MNRNLPAIVGTAAPPGAFDAGAIIDNFTAVLEAAQTRPPIRAALARMTEAAVEAENTGYGRDTNAMRAALHATIGLAVDALKLTERSSS